MSDQLSQKSGKKSDAQKEDSSRHNFDPIPAASPVTGAFGERHRGSQSDEEASYTHNEKAPSESSKERAKPGNQ